MTIRQRLQRSGASQTAGSLTAQRSATSANLRAAQRGVVAVFFVHGLLFASWAAHIPHVKAHLGLDDGTLGLALLGTPVGSVSAMAAAAYLIPRLGSRRIVQITLIGYSLAGPIVGITGSVPGLFAALFVWGAFQGTLDIAMNTQAIAVERRLMRPLMNGMHASWSIGAFAGAGAGAAGVALGVTLSVQLLILGIPALVIAGGLTVRMLTDDAAGAKKPGEAAVATSGSSARRRVSTTMLLLGAIAFASMLCEGAAADWSSVYLHDSVGGAVGIAGLGYAAFALAMVVVRIAGNRLLARFGARRVLPALALLASAGMILALAVGTVALGLLAFFLLGLGVGTVVPTAFSAAGRLPGIHPGQGVAGVSGLGWAGFVTGPPVIGQLATATSLPVALGLVPVLTALIAVGALTVPAMRG